MLKNYAKIFNKHELKNTSQVPLRKCIPEFHFYLIPLKLLKDNLAGNFAHLI